MTDEIKTPVAAQPGANSPGAHGSDSPQPQRSESVVTRLMHAGNDEGDALLVALGMRNQLSGEAQDLARLVERRLTQIEWGTHSEALDELEIQRAFLVHRFIGPMKRYERGSHGYAYLDNFLNLVSILAGIGASLAAALDFPKVWPIVFGLVVGFLQSISQWLKPSQRATRRSLAAAALRNEMWAFLQRRERYRGKDDRTAWALLADQVDQVEDRASAQQDQEAAQVHEGYRNPQG